MRCPTCMGVWLPDWRRGRHDVQRGGVVAPGGVGLDLSCGMRRQLGALSHSRSGTGGQLVEVPPSGTEDQAMQAVAGLVFQWEGARRLPGTWRAPGNIGPPFRHPIAG
jgi:hypothetical protein